MPNTDLIYEILDYFDVRQLVPVAAINRFHSITVRKYMQQRFGAMTGRFFKNKLAFSRMLTDLRAVVSGSAALHLMLPPKTTYWTPQDLDIYAPYVHYISICARMLSLGYSFTDEPEPDPAPYTYSQIKEIVSFSDGTHKVHLIFSKSTTAFAPIFEFHSTAVMNFVSPRHLFCAYPNLTFNGLSIINPGAAYLGRFDVPVVDALRKYNLRGFHYVNCSALQSCTTNGRTITDNKGFWLNFKQLPNVNKTALELFNSYQAVDAHWTLGGKICSVHLQRTFVFPRLQLIENDAYVSFHNH